MEKFYLGLDIGTDSVGIAATDENYRLLRAKGKDLWGSDFLTKQKRQSIAERNVRCEGVWHAGAEE